LECDSSHAPGGLSEKLIALFAIIFLEFHK
jgi:hypothetical protein